MPPSDSSTRHTNTSHTLFSNTCTTKTQTHFHTTDHFHHTNSTTQPQLLSPSSLPSYPKQTGLKKTKNLLALHQHPLPQPPQLPPPSPPLHLPCSRRAKQSTQFTIPKRHAPSLIPFISNDIRLKRHKNYFLAFAHRRTSLTTHPTTSSTSHTTSTTKSSPYIKVSTTPVQSTSIVPIHDTPSTITNTATPITAINIPTPTATINITTTATQIQIPYLMELKISLPPKLCTPSPSLTISLLSSTPLSLIFPHKLQKLQ